MDNEKSNESLVNTAFAFAGILAYFIASILLEVAAGTGVATRAMAARLPAARVTRTWDYSA